MEKNMKVFRSATWLTCHERTLIKAAILILSVMLWLSVFYCSLFSDSTASILSFLAVSSTVLMVRNEFCEIRKIDVIIIKIIDLMSKLLILFGIIAIFARLWNTVFYSLFSGIFIKHMILKMRRSSANCAHLNLNVEMSSDYDRGLKNIEIDKGKVNQQNLVLNENIAIEQCLTNLKYNEGIKSENKSKECQDTVLEDDIKLNKKYAVEIQNNAVENSYEDTVKKVFSNIPETLSKSSDLSDDVEGNEIISSVVQNSPKEFFIERDKGGKSCPKISIHCRRTGEAREFIQHKVIETSENSEDLRPERIISNSEYKRLESSTIKMRHAQSNFDESIELNATNDLKGKCNDILSDIFGQREIFNANKGAVELNIQNGDKELSMSVKEIPKLRMNLLDMDDIPLNPNEIKEHAEVRNGHLHKSRNVNLIDDSNQKQPEKFSIKSEETYEKVNNLSRIHNGNEMVKSNQETRTLEVQFVVQQERNELKNDLPENATLSAQIEDSRVTLNLRSESVNKRVMNTNVSIETKEILKLENKYNIESGGLREHLSSRIVPEIHSKEILQSAELCHSAISRDQSSLEAGLKTNPSNSIKTDLDEENVKQANESETKACMGLKNNRILSMDSNVENIVNRIDLSFIYAVG